MANPITLFIVEGEKRDVRFLNDLAKEFMPESREIKTYILPAAKNIYMLYEQLEKDDFETDIVEILRESSNEAAKILEGLHRDDIDDIFLFFDFDPQHFKREGTEDAAILISEALEKMFVVFNNETEFGKLYVSYPMIEALYDYKRDGPPCVAHSNCYLSLDDVSRYKTLAGENNPIASEHRPQWKEALNVFVSKVGCLFERESLDFSEYRKLITPSAVYREEMRLLVKNEMVFCLSSLPEFLLDYYREEFWIENIGMGNAPYTECEHRADVFDSRT